MPEMFGNSGFSASSTNHNPMKDFEVQSPPEDSVSCIKFSPNANILVAGSWANDVRCWQVQDNGQAVPKAQQMHQGPILDVCWNDDGTKVFTASADKTANVWDLASNQFQQVAQHEAPVKTCHWIKGSNYSCLMTGSWDKTLKLFPMAMVSCADKKLICYKLENGPEEYTKIESPLKYQHRCISIFKDKNNAHPAGFALGSIEGRVAIHYIQTSNPRDNFTFKCHRSPNASASNPQDIYAVNGISFNPVFGTLSTVGSDGRYNFWDKDARTKLKGSEQLNQPISCCSINYSGDIFAYAASYDWSKGHEHYNPDVKPYIFLRNCADDMKPRKSK